MSRQVKLFLIFGVVVVGGLFGVYLLDGFASVPEAFVQARLQGAAISANIVKLSNETASDLEKVNELDRNRDYKAAIELTSALIAKSRDIREEAVKLSAETERMTRSLSGINSFEARQAALEAISNHLALLSRLINYSASLGKLMETLQTRFEGGRISIRPAQLINDINAEVTAINAFNEQAKQAMERFDKVTR